MEKYVLFLLVTSDQEQAIQNLFQSNGWVYTKTGCKPFIGEEMRSWSKEPVSYRHFHSGYMPAIDLSQQNYHGFHTGYMSEATNMRANFRVSDYFYNSMDLGSHNRTYMPLTSSSSTLVPFSTASSFEPQHTSHGSYSANAVSQQQIDDSQLTNEIIINTQSGSQKTFNQSNNEQHLQTNHLEIENRILDDSLKNSLPAPLTHTSNIEDRNKQEDQSKEMLGKCIEQHDINETRHSEEHTKINMKCETPSGKYAASSAEMKEESLPVTYIEIKTLNTEHESDAESDNTVDIDEASIEAFVIQVKEDAFQTKLSDTGKSISKKVDFNSCGFKEKLELKTDNVIMENNINDKQRIIDNNVKADKQRSKKVKSKATLSVRSKHRKLNGRRTEKSSSGLGLISKEKRYSVNRNLRIHAFHKKCKTIPQDLNDDNFSASEKGYYCADCKFIFVKKNKLLLHKKLKAGGICVADCIYCDAEENKKDIFYCTKCPKVFDTKELLERHAERHAVEVFTCKHCDQTFYTIPDLNCHMQNEHKVEMETHLCDLCGSRFKDKKILNQHRKYVHTDERPEECPTCRRRFKNKSQLRNHLVVHKDASDLDLSCEVCGKMFVRVATLKDHVRRHRKEFTFFCNTCGKGFYKKSGMEEHMRVHTGDKPFTCKVCGYKCALRCNLVKHIRKHSKQLPKRDDLMEPGKALYLQSYLN
ncbi:zinc finger protein 37-like [Dreissena polymorpha]|uniref:C2H2-type domain-containing protein n=1 Tax=Dreissena polymorpha TaxID=45954 RepID=A0A9D4LQS1_DREPO|nr:zinc finger protein 37-like [Dreissena polymorpha]XP_052262848.1 zinc finger protein 37-like [Dreissena polymorpha]KAH3863003.1 hypothetical protein DPMN_025979 [Dreissena polymorpha]